MTSEVYTCRPADTLKSAVGQIRKARTRRLPVVDDDNRPIGILSLNDIALSAAARRQSDVDREVVEMLAAVCEPRGGLGRTDVTATIPRKAAPRKVARRRA
jgi:CBS domain-containing protein